LNTYSSPVSCILYSPQTLLGLKGGGIVLENSPDERKAVPSRLPSHNSSAVPRRTRLRALRFLLSCDTEGGRFPCLVVRNSHAPEIPPLQPEVLPLKPGNDLHAERRVPWPPRRRAAWCASRASKRGWGRVVRL